MTNADHLKRIWRIAASAGILFILSILGAAEAGAAGWTAAANLTSAREFHTATLLPSGKVLVTGGFNGGYLASAELFDPATGAWTATGSLNSARSYHTATLLPSGKVLVAGGYNGGFPAAAELYDPATGVWSATGNLTTPRSYHTATLLSGGKVLVAGGYNGGDLAGAELYDPATGVWTATGSMATTRIWHTATLLPSGKVLVAGGDSGGWLASAELFDPAANGGIGGWIATGNLSTARGYHTATLLANGKVLAAGGYDGGYLAGAELFDPAANGGVGAWTATGNLTTARDGPTATLLPSGKVLVAGGLSGGGYLAGAELFDPAGNAGAGAWIAAGSLATTRRMHTATLLPSGKVLVAGGYNGGYLASCEIYDPAAGAWAATASLAAGRRSHTATLLPSGKVLVAGGYDGVNILAGAELYDPATGTWTATASLTSARQLHTATLLPNGKVLVTGGWNSGGLLAGTEIYDPALGTWTATASLTAARGWHTATLLPSGKVLVAGGLGGGGSLVNAELYDPSAGTWTATASLTAARVWHTATLLPNGKVLVAGGADNSGYLAGAEIFDPALGTWTATGSLTTVRGFHTATLLPTGKVLVAGGANDSGILAAAEIFDPAGGIWTATASLTAAREYHAATLLPGGEVLVTGGRDIAGAFLAGAELFDPAAGTWTSTASLNTARYHHTATLLPTGKVLAAGGYNGGYLAGAELYDPGLGYPDAWRPTATALTSPLFPGTALQITGTGFRGYGYTEASGGSGVNSATNYPLVQLRRLDSGQSNWLLPDPATPFSATSFTSAPVTGATAGPALVTLFVNGIPSLSRAIVIGIPPAITSANGTTFTVGSAGTFTVTATGNPTPALSKTGALPAGVTFVDNGNATATLAGTPASGTNGVYPVVITAANGAPSNATQNFTLTVNENPDADFDYDSVRDPVERGPDGNDPGYDGNRDGIPDWRQSNVASFFAFDQERGRRYLTLALASGARIETLSVQRAFDVPPPAGVSFPYGFFSFAISGLAAGGATTATIFLDGPPPQTYYKYGKTPDIPVDHWYEFAYDGETGAEVVGSTVVLHFVDGKRGDHDLEANGRITDPGGPAEIAPHAGLYFPYLVSTGDEKTEIGIINTKRYASQAAISYYGANGDLRGTAAIGLGPYGKATIPSAGIPLGSASAIVSGDGAFVGYTRYANGAGQRCAWPAATFLQKTFSVPHTAVNREWATALGLFNPHDAAVEVTLLYETGGSSKLALNPKASACIRLTEVEPAISIVSTGYIAAMEMFDSLLSGGDRAALLLRERPLNALYVPSLLSGPGEFTGVGLTGRHHGTVTITGHRVTGGTEELAFGTRPLGGESPWCRVALDLSGMLGEENLWAKISGLAGVSTPFGAPLIHFQGLAVYGKDDARKLGVLDLNALRFREGFIGIASPAAETTVTLLNPDTAEAALTATGHSAAGATLAGNTILIAAGARWTGTITDLLNSASGADLTHIRLVSDGDIYGFETISAADRIEMLPVMGRE